MHRIFSGLAVLALALLLSNFLLGLSGGDYNATAHAFYAAGKNVKTLRDAGAEPAEVARAEQRQAELFEAAKSLQPTMTRHMLLGIGSALLTLLVCSVSITYFVGTSRWFKEVADTYRLTGKYVLESARVKRRSFRWSFAGALAIVLVVALGAASEPTWANAQNSEWYVTPHYVAALAAVSFLTVSFYMQAQCLAENSRLIDAVMNEVRRKRAERGLEVEPTKS